MTLLAEIINKSKRPAEMSQNPVVLVDFSQEVVKLRETLTSIWKEINELSVRLDRERDVTNSVIASLPKPVIPDYTKEFLVIRSKIGEIERNVSEIPILKSDDKDLEKKIDNAYKEINRIIDAVNQIPARRNGGAVRLLTSSPTMLLSAATLLTISGGIISVTQTYHTVDTEAGAGSDNLDTINGAADGQVVLIRPANDARSIVVKNGTGNITCGTDTTLDSSSDSWMGVYDATLAKFIEVSRSDNAP